jgi:hypothetical protein
MITDAHHESDDEHDDKGGGGSQAKYHHDLDTDGHDVDDDRRRDVTSMAPHGV